MAVGEQDAVPTVVIDEQEAPLPHYSSVSGPRRFWSLC